MAPGTHVRSGRYAIVTCGMVAIWLLLAARLVQVQWVSRSSFASRAERQRLHVETIPARPGEIVDRHGHVLAMTVTRRSLFLNPSRISQRWAVARQLGQVIDINTDDLFRRLSENPARQFLWVKRRLTELEVEAVRSLRLEEGTWGFRDEYQRRYPQGRLAAHVLGLRDIDNQGHGGLEESFDGAIRGVDGNRILVRDARGAVIDIRAGDAPRHGGTVVTTLDSILQMHVESELDTVMTRWRPTAACAIVIEPGSGEILAMASRPAFDPNNPPQQGTAWKNLCISAVYEPGSTVKPFIVGWAMEHGLLDREEIFDCEFGSWRMGRRVLHDTHSYGALNVADILVKSSNIGMAKIGERITNAGLFRSLLAFGFGRRTGIELPGERPGLIRPLEKWDDYSTGSVPIGQEIALTPLQLITAHAALANGGRMVLPRVSWRSIDSRPTPLDRINSGTVPAQVVSRTVQPDIARWLIRGPMQAVIERGTGTNARLPGVAVFGKTGTAQKLPSDQHVCSFVGGAPAENPQVLVLVCVDEPTGPGQHYGGTVAAPAAARILQRALHQGTRMTSAAAAARR